ncbi:MAG: HIT family protein, partial [Candidatus Rokuibacteriota bacterium]
MYERLGFARIGERTLEDADRSREYGFWRRLRPGAPAGATQCALCRIAAGELKADRIVETARIVAFVNDIEPLSRGHSVFFPRRHAPTLHDADDGDLAEIMAAITNVARAMELEHYNVLQNNGARAGQTVFHVHVHLIPKWTDTDGLAVDHRAAGYIDQ